MNRLISGIFFVFLAFSSQADLPGKAELKQMYDKAKTQTKQAIETSKELLNNGKQAIKNGQQAVEQGYDATKKWVNKATVATKAGVDSVKEFFKEKPQKDYQKVKNYKSCFAVKTVHAKSYLCIPNHRPYLCPLQSYEQLKALNSTQMC